MSVHKLAANVLQQLEEKKGTVKSLVLAGKIEDRYKKKVFALVCETLKYRDVIDQLIERAEVMKTKPKLARPLAQVLVYDLVFGQGAKDAGAVLKAVMMKHKTRLQAELSRIKIKLKIKNNTDLIPAHIRNAVVLPRYVRVNTNLTTVERVTQRFVKDGFKLVSSTADLSKIAPKSVMPDKHIPNLLILPPDTDLHDHDLLKNGHIILQDKASCFPAFILNPPPGCTVIDACAAPGNKTSHLSAIMGNTGTIHAFDQDKRRLNTLIKLTGRAGCKNIKAVHTSFLDIKPEDPTYRPVEYILLDPSCSGSGIVRRLDHLVTGHHEADEDSEPAGEFSEERIRALSDFQATAIMHAFKFPNVKKVIYSTCSKFQQENEDVVARALSSQKDFVLAQNPFPEWSRRGVDSLGVGKDCVRTLPEEDYTIGFFVALFERSKI